MLLHKLASVFGAVHRASPAEEPRSPAQLAKAAAARRGARASRSRNARSSARSPTPSCRWCATCEAAGDLLADSDLVAAIAGDAVRAAAGGGRTRSRRRSRPTARLRTSTRRRTTSAPGRRLLAAQRHRRGAGRAQPGHPRPARYRKEPDHRDLMRRWWPAAEVLFAPEKRPPSTRCSPGSASTSAILVPDIDKGACANRQRVAPRPRRRPRPGRARDGPWRSPALGIVAGRTVSSGPRWAGGRAGPAVRTVAGGRPNQAELGSARRPVKPARVGARRLAAPEAINRGPGPRRSATSLRAKSTWSAASRRVRGA